jgi:hypothetical protein
MQFDAARLAQGATGRTTRGTFDATATDFPPNLVQVLLKVGFGNHGPLLPLK